MIRLTFTLKMTTVQVVEMSVTFNNSPSQDYVHPVYHMIICNLEMTPGFKASTVFR